MATVFYPVTCPFCGGKKGNVEHRGDGKTYFVPCRYCNGTGAFMEKREEKDKKKS